MDKQTRTSPSSTYLLSFVPKNHLSWIMGRLAYAPLPGVAASLLIRWFAKRYGAAIDEASKPLEAYRSLGDFFVRDLKPGLRPLGFGVVSPVDARLSEKGTVSEGMALQVKGKKYSVEKLFGGAAQWQLFNGGHYLNFYLAPGDYHHIHAPVSGRIWHTFYVPGKLWPVNDIWLERVEGLFTVNERIISLIETDNWGTVAVVMVGATNVGSIRLSYNKLRGNSFFWSAGNKPVHIHTQVPAVVEKGQRIGTFSLGSTVLLFFQPDRFRELMPCSGNRQTMVPEPGTSLSSSCAAKAAQVPRDMSSYFSNAALESCSLGKVKMGQSLGELI